MDDYPASLVWKRVLQHADREGCVSALPGLVLHQTCLADYLHDRLDMAAVKEAMTQLQALGLVDVEHRSDWNVYDASHPVLRVRNWRKVSPKRKAIPAALRRRVYERDGHACVTCGSTDDLSLDHIVPWSQDGPETEDNLQTMCRPCNSSKGAR